MSWDRKKFNATQNMAIESAVLSGVDPKHLINPNYTAMQITVIADGRGEGIDTTIFENENIRWQDMQIVKNALLWERDVKRFKEVEPKFVLIEMLSLKIHFYNNKILNTEDKEWYLKVEPMIKNDIKNVLLDRIWLNRSRYETFSLEKLIEEYNGIAGHGKVYLFAIDDFWKRIYKKYGFPKRTLSFQKWFDCEQDFYSKSENGSYKDEEGNVYDEDEIMEDFFEYLKENHIENEVE